MPVLGLHVSELHDRPRRRGAQRPGSNERGQTARTPREFHVIVDEDLARVEHYFSRFLSAMEVRSRFAPRGWTSRRATR
jgi:hypothetical protein